MTVKTPCGSVPLQIVLSFVFLLLSYWPSNATTVKFGLGVTVSEVDVILELEDIETGTDLTNYSEGGFFLRASNTQCCFNHVHFSKGGDYSFSELRSPTDVKMRAVEFLLSSGFGDLDQTVAFTVFSGGTTITDGTEAMYLQYVDSANPIDFKVIGIHNIYGFDTIRIAAGPTATFAKFGDYQAIAIAEIRIDLDDPIIPVNLPGAFFMLISSMMSFALISVLSRASTTIINSVRA